MDSRNGNAAAAAAPAPLPQHPHALLALPDLDRPPAVMEMWELEAVAAALPAKKRSLRETFDRLAACAPAPLPFRWEDLDTYISSLQYSVTLRRRQLRELDESRPAPALAAVSASFAATGDGVRQMRALEKPRPVHASAPIPPAVSEPAATGGDVHKPIWALEKPEPVHAAVLVLAAVSAPAATGVVVRKGKKRKASGQEAEATDRVPEMRKIHEDAAAKDAAASPLQDQNCKGKNLVPPGPGGDDGLVAAEANASADATVQVDPVNQIAVVQQELPVPVSATALHAPNATNRAKAGRLPLQRMSRPPRPIPAPAAVSAAPATGSQEGEPASQKMQVQDDLLVAENTSHDGAEAEVSPCRSGHGSGDGLPITASTTQAQVGVDPIGKITGVGHDSSNAASPPKVITSFSLPMVPKQEQQAVEEVPDVEMEIVEAEETKHEHPNDEVPDVEMEIVEPEEMQALKDDAPVADEKASPLQVKAQEAGKVSPVPLACSDGLAQAGARAATATQADAAGATVRSSPAATRDASDDAARFAPAGTRDDASKVTPVPPRRGNGLAPPSGSGTSADDAMQTAAACKSAAAVARRDSPAAARRGVGATDLVPATGRDAAGPPQARAPPRASNKHVLQKQHMYKQGYHDEEPISSGQKQIQSFSRNHGGRPAGFRPVPEAQAAAARWNRPPGEWSGGPGRGGFAAAGGLQGEGSRSKGNAKRKPPKFCNKCGCKGHLAENCRTAKHLVALYQRAKEEEQNQICYRCGCTGHWSRKCRTPKHLVDLYQKDRAAKRAARSAGTP